MTQQASRASGSRSMTLCFCAARQALLLLLLDNRKLVNSCSAASGSRRPLGQGTTSASD